MNIKKIPTPPHSLRHSTATVTKSAVSLAALVGTALDGQAQAIIHYDTGNTFTVGSLGALAANWDIDANEASNGHEFSIFTNSSTSALHLLGPGNGAKLKLFAADKIHNLATTQSIGATALFAVNNAAIFSSGAFQARFDQFTLGQSGILGFTFNPDGTQLYGWADVTFSVGGTYGLATVNEWAYDSTGSSILAGQTVVAAVPEPATAATGLALLALGAAGLRRKRRKQAA